MTAGGRKGVKRFLKKLHPRDRDMLRLRFGLRKGSEPLTLQEVGDEFGISRERVRQIEKRAIARLRDIAAREHPELLDMLSA